jgi:CO/xanthine dehydrogenase Mo-binding subunit
MAKSRSVRSTLTSRSRFITDLLPPDSLECRILRSPISSGTFSLDHSSHLTETSGLLTWKDIPGRNAIHLLESELPLLCEHSISYAGEPIALLYGTTSFEIDQLSDQVNIQWNPDGKELLTISDKTLVRTEEYLWDLEDTNQGTKKVLKKTGKKPSSLSLQEYQSENVDEDSQDESFYMEREISSHFEVGSQFHAVQETVMAAASWVDGILTVLVPSSWPHSIGANLAKILKIPQSKIRVEATIPGMYHDRLLIDSILVSAYAALVCCLTGKPAHCSFGHGNEEGFSTKQAPLYYTHTAQITPVSGISSLDICIKCNQGAYPMVTNELIRQIIGSANPAYASTKGKIRVEIHKTNLYPMSIFHGFLSEQVQALGEIQINRIAHVLGMDPLLMRIGLIDQESKLGGANCLPLIQLTEELGDFSRKYASYELLRKQMEASPTQLTNQFRSLRGIGAALGFQGNGFSKVTESNLSSKVKLLMKQDGSVELRAATTPGSGTLKSHLRDIIRDTLEVKDEMITIIPSDSSQVPDAGPLSVSRSVSIMNHLVLQACHSLQKMRFRTPLPIEVQKSFTSPRGKTVQAPHGYPWLKPTWACGAVEVEIDPSTYIPSVLGIWLVVQAGSLLNFQQARAHLEGTVIQSVNWVLHQRWTQVGGYLEPRVSRLRNLLGSSKTPKIHITFVDEDGFPISEKKSGHIEEEPLGIGEIAQSIIPSALISALSQAAGRFFDQIPVSPQEIYQYMELP